MTWDTYHYVSIFNGDVVGIKEQVNRPTKSSDVASLELKTIQLIELLA